MAGRKIRDREDAQACLKAARAARGQSKAQWARQQGIDGRSLEAWRRNLARRGKGGSGRQEGRMVELVAGPVRKTATGRARKAAEAVGRGRYVIRCGALAVEVDGQFHDETLRRLLQVVVGC
jgi:hypothetical protein